MKMNSIEWVCQGLGVTPFISDCDLALIVNYTGKYLRRIVSK